MIADDSSTFNLGLGLKDNADELSDLDDEISLAEQRKLPNF